MESLFLKLGHFLFHLGKLRSKEVQEFSRSRWESVTEWYPFFQALSLVFFFTKRKKKVLEQLPTEKEF